MALELETVNGQHLAQLFVPGYYTLKTYAVNSVLMALTDSKMGHCSMCPKRIIAKYIGITPMLSVNWAHTCAMEEVISNIAACLCKVVW